jgi:hypothetical protein
MSCLSGVHLNNSKVPISCGNTPWMAVSNPSAPASAENFSFLQAIVRWICLAVNSTNYTKLNKLLVESFHERKKQMDYPIALAVI